MFLISAYNLGGICDSALNLNRYLPAHPGDTGNALQNWQHIYTLTITPAGTQNEPTIVLLFYSSNMNIIIFCHVLYSPPISMLVNRVFEIYGELQAELVLAIMPNPPTPQIFRLTVEFSLYVVMLMWLWHWKRRVVVLATWSSLVAQWVFRMTTYGATSGSRVVGLTSFCFRCDSCELWNNFRLWSFQAFKWNKINNLHGIQWIDMTIYIMIPTFWFMCVPICCRVSEVNKHMVISPMLITYAWIISHVDVLINLNSFFRRSYKS